LSETQITSPAVAVGKGNKKRYLQMTQKPANGDGLSINKDSNKKLKVMYRGKVYNVHDNTVGEN
jgi:hypothetical protein